MTLSLKIVKYSYHNDFIYTCCKRKLKRLKRKYFMVRYDDIISVRFYTHRINELLFLKKDFVLYDNLQYFIGLDSHLINDLKILHGSIPDKFKFIIQPITCYCTFDKKYSKDLPLYVKFKNKSDYLKFKLSN